MPRMTSRETSDALRIGEALYAVTRGLGLVPEPLDETG